ADDIHTCAHEEVHRRRQERGQHQHHGTEHHELQVDHNHTVDGVDVEPLHFGQACAFGDLRGSRRNRRLSSQSLEDDYQDEHNPHQSDVDSESHDRAEELPYDELIS